MNVCESRFFCWTWTRNDKLEIELEIKSGSPIFHSFFNDTLARIVIIFSQLGLSTTISIFPRWRSMDPLQHVFTEIAIDLVLIASALDSAEAED